MGKNFVEIIETTAKDGIQNEHVTRTPDQEIGLIGRIEVARRRVWRSHVSPIPSGGPQMAGTVFGGLPREGLTVIQ